MIDVRTVLAPNPSMYTGPGTNTYVITSGVSCVIVDPGPVIAEHRTAIEEAIEGSTPVGVLVTHTHSDHAPLANPLAAALDVPALGHAPGPDFEPNHRLVDGQLLPVGDDELEVIATPGHADDHLCFAAGDLLFTGDHIMGGSTVVIQDLTAYLASLRRVQKRTWRKLFPGHGPLIENAAEIIDEYIEHRLDRERQILGALEDGAASVGAVVEAVYVDVPVGLHPIAAFSVAAHLGKLVDDGRVVFDQVVDEVWDAPVQLTETGR